MIQAWTRRLLSAAPAAWLTLAGTSPVAAAPALVQPVFLLPYGAADKLVDYRPTINAAGTRIVFERQVVEGTGYGTTNLYISDLASPSPQRLSSQDGSARADWCWYRDRPFLDGPIAYSDGDGVKTVAPVAGSAPNLLRGTAGWIYPYWFTECRHLAVYAANVLPYTAGATTKNGPETLAVDAATGQVGRPLSGTSLWAGFPSVDRRIPGLLAFAGQQFSTTGYDQDRNYVYLADFRVNPPATRPLDPGASTASFDPRYQGRAPVWSPDGRWIAFESNRACANSTGSYAVFVQNALGRATATQITDCSYNVQHPKWYRHPVGGRILLIASALLHPTAGAKQPLLRAARGIASLDVTAVVAP